MKIVRWISRLVGNLLIVSGISVFLLSLFLSQGIQNLPRLEEDLLGLLTKDSLVDELGVTEEQLNLIDEICAKDPSQEFCMALEDPSKIIKENSDVQNILSEAKSYQTYADRALTASIILFILGSALTLFGAGLLSGISNIGVTGSVVSVISVIYYQYLPDMISKIIVDGVLKDVVSNIPKEVVDGVLNVVFNWIDEIIYFITVTGIIMAVIFAAMSVVVFVIRKKLR